MPEFISFIFGAGLILSVFALIYDLKDGKDVSNGKIWLTFFLILLLIGLCL